MDDRLAHRRRVLIAAYRRLLLADRNWTEAESAARTWIRDTPKSVALIGAPNSRMRALYSQRDRALERFQVARLKLEVSRRRFEERSIRRSLLLLPSTE